MKKVFLCALLVSTGHLVQAAGQESKTTQELKSQVFSISNCAGNVTYSPWFGVPTLTVTGNSGDVTVGVSKAQYYGTAAVCLALGYYIGKIYS